MTKYLYLGMFSSNAISFFQHPQLLSLLKPSFLISVIQVKMKHSGKKNSFIVSNGELANLLNLLGCKIFSLVQRINYANTLMGLYLFLLLQKGCQNP